MEYEDLKKCFPEGLVFSQHQIAQFELRNNPTGTRISFDSACSILGEEALEEALEKGAYVLSPQENKMLVSIS